MSHAIATLYDGIEYRSRLEARWGAFFDHIGWKFTYEPFDGNGYIPDFLIHGQAPFLVEIKPAVTRADYYAPIAKIEAGEDTMTEKLTPDELRAMLSAMMAAADCRSCDADLEVVVARCDDGTVIVYPRVSHAPGCAAA
jgi:hypothetical protein